MSQPQDIHQSDDLLSRTWKTVVVLVGACIVFVGALSAAAVFVTDRAVAPSTRAATDESGELKKSETKTAAPPAANTAAKKPLPI